MIDKQKVARRFSRNAKTYDRYANVQKVMAQQLLRQLTPLKTPARILEIGCGTGYLTALLATRFPQADITALDIAQGMIDVAAARPENQHVTFLCADAEETALEGSYDLVISNATFQWFNQPEQTLRTHLNHLSRDGQLAISTFGPQTFQELHQTYASVATELQLKDTPAPGQSFLSAGELHALVASGDHVTVNAREELLPEHFDNCLAFLQSVKKIGANRANDTGKRPVPGFIDQVMRRYDEVYSCEGQVVATYHALYMTATRKPM